MKKNLFTLLFLILNYFSFGQAGFDQNTLTVNNFNYGGPNNGIDNNPAFSGTNLGNFTSSGSLVLNGSYAKLYDNRTANYDIFQVEMYYRVYKAGTTAPSYSVMTFSYNSNLYSSGGYDHPQWQNYSPNINLLALVTQGNATQNVDVYWVAHQSINGSGNTPITTSVVTATFFADATLAVELADFSGKKATNNINLNWLTASEKDNAYFSVERSQNGTDFKSIGEVKATNAIQGSTYNYTDAAPVNGVNYYRLNAVDFSGKSEFSKVISVVYGSAGELSLRIAPNPTHDKITLATVTDNTTATIFDVNGRLIQTSALTSRDISISNLTNGIYFLRLNDAGGNLIGQERFVKF